MKKLMCYSRFKATLLPFLFLLLYVTSCSEHDEYEKITQDFVASSLTDAINADSIQGHVEWLQGMGTRYALADNRRDIAIKIRDKFISLGYANTRLDSFMLSISGNGLTFNGWQYNIIATLEGALHPDSVCIVGAHYDDTSEPVNRYTNAPGANDNASGVAATIEIARVMKKNHFLPNNTIKFIAFGAEETGLNGSSDYASKAFQAGEKIKIMLNNDMIAYETGNDFSDWDVNIIDYQNSHDTRLLAENMSRRYTSLSYVNDNTYSHYSDSYPFSIYGYKALFFISHDSDNNYHTINDKAIYCNFDYCSHVTEISCAMLVFQSWWPYLQY